MEMRTQGKSVDCVDWIIFQFTSRKYHPKNMLYVLLEWLKNYVSKNKPKRTPENHHVLHGRIRYKIYCPWRTESELRWTSHFKWIQWHTKENTVCKNNRSGYKENIINGNRNTRKIGKSFRVYFADVVDWIKHVRQFGQNKVFLR